MDKTFDVVIIGEGPAGLTAAIYAKRAELSTLLIERFGAGGQILNTYEVDNYPGLPGISGFDLGTKMSEHADKFGVERTFGDVKRIDTTGDIKTVVTDAGEYKAYTVIIATGNSPRLLEVPGEEELTGCGVSYCATCDGAFFKNKTVAVVGGGDVAVEDAIFLARGCSKVYLIHRRDELRAAKVLQTALFATDNIEVIWNSTVSEIKGEDNVEALLVHNKNTQEDKLFEVSGVFIATGNTPNLPEVEGLALDEKGYVKADETGVTNIPGVFVAGDIRSKKLRQVSTAVADGANAVYSVQEYLVSLTKE